MADRNTFTARQLALYIVSAQIGLGVILLPSALARRAGHDGWMAVVFTGLLTTAVALSFVSLIRRHGGKSIYEINRLLFGKIVGTVLNIVLLLYLNYSTILAIRFFTELIQLFWLGFVPPIVAAIIIIIPTYYLVAQGIQPLSRFSAFLLVVMAAIATVFFLLRGDIRLSLLRPVGTAGMKAVIRGIPEVFLTYTGLELAVFAYPWVRDKESTLRWVVIANLFTTLFILAIVVMTTGLFGEKLLGQQLAPLFELPRLVRVPVFERLDLLFILLWFPFLESTVRSFYYASVEGLRGMLGLERGGWFLALYTASAILLSRLPADFAQVLELTKFVTYSGAFVFLLLVFTWVWSLVSRRGVTE